MTAKQWWAQNSRKHGNMRDYEAVEQHIVLSNLECRNFESVQVTVKINGHRFLHIK